MLTTPVLRPWRPIWDAALGSATRRLDDLATERQKGRSSPPQVAPEVLRLVGEQRVQTVLRGPQLPEVRDFIQVMQEVEPLLRACVWPRWLLLETALEKASNLGDLHVSALILRTQIEELDALRTVAAVLRPTDASWDEAVLATAISTLNSRVLPRLQAKAAEQLLEPSAAAAGSATRPARLQKAFDELSEYVHPNYGSHILSVRPHSAEAASVFVEAFVAIYEAFLSLPWAQEVDERPPSPRETQLELSPAFLVLAEDAVRTLAPALPFAEIGPVPWIDAVNRFHRCVERERDQEAWARSMENGEIPVEGLNLDVEAIRALREHSVPPGDWPESLRTAAGRVRYAFLVEDERRLVEAAERLGPGAGRRDNEAWLSLLLSGLTFAINVTEFKLDSMARMAARLINAENVLGATLAVRSMLEHHAVAIELGTKLQALWKRAEQAAPSEEQIADAFAEAEKQIARVLAGSTVPRERSASWRTLWEQTVRKPYNVLGPIKALDAKRPGFLETYGLLSHIVHGTICTGGDLLETRAGGSKAGQRTLAQLILNLASLCDVDAMRDRQAASMTTADRLDVIRRDRVGLGPRIKAMRLLEAQKLKPGRDIFGSGTASDPYRFRDGLLYHDAYYHYLEQEGIRVRSRRVEKLEGGVGDRVETEDGRVLYFLNDKLSLR